MFVKVHKNSNKYQVTVIYGGEKNHGTSWNMYEIGFKF